MRGIEIYRGHVRASLERQNASPELAPHEAEIIERGYREAVSCAATAAAIRADRSMQAAIGHRAA